jgi:hypothetical protein
LLSSGLASNFHLEVGFLHNVLRAAHLLIAWAPFRVRLMCPIRQVMDSPGLSADPAFASRSFPLPLGIWALSSRSAYCRSVEPLSDRPHRGLHVPHEEDAVGVGASFTPRSTVFIRAGVVHKLRSACDHSSSSQPGYFDDLLLFRGVDKDLLSFTRPTFA